MVLKRIMESVGRWADAFFEQSALIGVALSLLLGFVVVVGGDVVVTIDETESALGLPMWIGAALLVVGALGLVAVWLKATKAIWGAVRKGASKRYRAGKFLWEE